MDKQQLDKQKSLDLAVAGIEKQFGKGAVMKMGEKPSMGIEAISTGALSLDIALGIGGLPRGRITEIYGPESSGKSTLAMHVVAEAQRNGGICAYIDAEHAMDPVYAKGIGVNIDELLISQPDTGEQALEITDMLIRSGAIDVVVIDSVAALTPRAEIEGEMGDTHVGLQARLMSQALRKLTGSLSKSNTSAIFINQLREKIGVMFGSPETTPGGRALKFYSSVRIDIRRIESLKDGSEVVGNRVRCKVAKNKCVAAGTLVFDPVTSRISAIEDLVRSDAPASVVAADKCGQLSVQPVTQRLDQGEAEVVGLRLRDGTRLRVTPDHKVLTDRGWVEAGALTTADRVARPRRWLGFGDERPITPDQARLLGYLIGDGDVGGKTPVSFIGVAEDLHNDVANIVATMGCDVHRRGLESRVSHRLGEHNGVLDLVRWAGVHGHLAPTKALPPAFFEPGLAEDVAANLAFGLFETDGWVSREQTGALRLGHTTTSEQLAHQLHWLLLRWGITSTVRRYDPTTKRPSIIDGRRVQGKHLVWEVRVSGIDNVRRFAEAIPMWGPRGRALVAALADPALAKHRGGQSVYLQPSATELVLAYLRHGGVTPSLLCQLLDVDQAKAGSGLKAILGTRRIRRDRIEALADALDSRFLRDLLADDLWWDRVTAIEPAEWAEIFDIEVAEHHTFVADDVVVHNCAPPFRQAEFDIQFGKGISREGSLIDIGVDLGIVKKSGAWYTYEGEQLGQGRENAKAFLVENVELMIEIDDRVRRQVGLRGNDDAGEPDPLGFAAADEQPISLDG